VSLVVDASALIALFDTNDVHNERAFEQLSRAISTDEQLITCPVTLAEFLVGPTCRGHLAGAVQAVQHLGIVAEPLPADAAPRLAQLRVDSGLTLPDCCVLLAAQTGQGVALLTFDAALATAAERVGIPTRTD
jgi:predicted nucleic acid-binding protein